MATTEQPFNKTLITNTHRKDGMRNYHHNMGIMMGIRFYTSKIPKYFKTLAS